jgi:YbbR domain-containing protein
LPKNVIILIVSILFAVILWGSISLSEIYYANINANLTLINFPRGYTTGSELPLKISVKVRGQGWRLLSSKIGSDEEFLVSVNSDSGKKIVNLQNNIAMNQWIMSDLEVIEIEPDTIIFIVEKILTKKVPILPELILGFRTGYGLASKATYQPEAVTLTGAKSRVKNISEILIDSITFSSLDKKVTKIIDLPRFSGVTYSENSIKLTLDVQRIVDKVFEEIPVEVIDVPKDRNVVLLPNKVGCNLRGGIDFLGKLKIDQLRAYVYYNDIVKDTVGSIIPNIQIPENTSLQFIKPERLRYVIKTY